MTSTEILKLAEDVKNMTNTYDVAIALTELYYKGKSDSHNEMFKTVVSTN